MQCFYFVQLFFAFSFPYYQFCWLFFASPRLGCCTGLRFDEAHSICACFGEAFSFWLEIWVSEAVLYRSSRRQCHIHSFTREYDKCKPSWTGFPTKRRWSLTVFLQASSPTQVIGRDLKSSFNLKTRFSI